MGAAVSGAKACAVSIASALLLSACASTTDGSAVFGNLLAFNSLNAPPRVAQKAQIQVDCPEVKVDDANSSVRTYSGADHTNDAVRYQFDIAQTARQCEVENGQIAIKVGVSGRVVIGPAGSPGAFTVPIRIAIQRAGDHKTVVDALYRTPVVVPADEGQTLFTTISQPLLVPYTRQAADQDYTISVSFDQGVAVPAKRRPKRPRRG